MTTAMRGMRGDDVAGEVAAGLAKAVAFPTDGRSCLQAFPDGVSSTLLNLVRTPPFSRNVRDFASSRGQNSFTDATKEIWPIAGWLFSMGVF